MCPQSVTDSHIQKMRKVQGHNETSDNDHHEDIIIEQERSEEPTTEDGAYWTEGIRNPGWLTVVGTWIAYFVVAGTTSTWGVFQAEYNKMYSNEIAVSFIGTTAVSTSMLGILVMPLIRRVGVRYTMLIGTLISTVALVLASFATELWQLLLTQGLMFGIGLCIVFSTLATLPSQWFVKNRALANGIAWSGATLGPVACSNGFEALLTTFGRQVTLAIMAGSVFILLLIAAILARPRYAVVHAPKDDAISPEKDSDKPPLWSIRFMVILLSSFTYPFHWQVAFFLAPSYAQYLGASPSLAASTVTIVFAMTAISRIVFGFLADRYGRLNILSIAVFINAILFMTLWRYADTIVMFATFCGLLGVWGGHFANMRPVIISDLVGMKRAQKGVCLSYLLSVPACFVGDPFVSYIRLRYGWIIAIQTMGAFGLCSAMAILVVRFLMNKRLFVIV